jgi:hypothetical protein
MSQAITDVKTLINKFFDDSKIVEDSSTDPGKSATEEKAGQQKTTLTVAGELSKADQDKNTANEGNRSAVLGVIGTLVSSITDLTKGLGAKYKHVLMGIVSALTGAPSTPWHVTIGNPLRPIFSSGDMYTDSVKLTLGPTLAFNDLPSSVDIEFTLTSARTCGIDEIFRKLSTGEIRFSSSSAPSFYNNNPADEEAKKPENSPTVTDSKNEELSDLQPSQINKNTKVGSANAVGLTSSNGTQVNPDPNSSPIQAPIQNIDPNGGFTDEELAAISVDENTSSSFTERLSTSRARQIEDDTLRGTNTVIEPLRPLRITNIQ